MKRRIRTHVIVQAATAACAATIWVAHVFRPELEAICATIAAIAGVFSGDVEARVRAWRAHLERELEGEL